MTWLTFGLMIAGATVWAWRVGDPRYMRTAGALAVNWLLGLVIIILSGNPTPWVWLLILDGLTAAAIMARPAARAQAAIGGVLISQMLLHGAYGWIGSHPNDAMQLYLSFLNLGWIVQLLILAGGLCNVGGRAMRIVDRVVIRSATAVVHGLQRLAGGQ